VITSKLRQFSWQVFVNSVSFQMKFVAEDLIAVWAFAFVFVRLLLSAGSFMSVAIGLNQKSFSRTRITGCKRSDKFKQAHNKPFD
jgi:hypothetical protein